MPDDRRDTRDPAEAAREDVRRANQHAERKLEQIREEVRQEIDRTEAATRDRDEVGERPVTPKDGR